MSYWEVQYLQWDMRHIYGYGASCAKWQALADAKWQALMECSGDGGPRIPKKWRWDP